MQRKAYLITTAVIAIITFINMPCIAQGKAQESKKLINLGWDCPSTSYLRNHYLEMENNAPYDGISINVIVKDDQGKFYDRYMFFAPTELKREWFKKALEDLQACKFKKFTDNFLRFTFVSSRTKMPDWFDDSRWKTISNNISNLAWLAKQSGCKGLILDPEDYNSNFLFKYNFQNGKSFKEVAAQVRMRGNQLMNAIAKEFPDVNILCLWMFSLNQIALNSPDPTNALLHSGYGLYPAFLNGMLDAMPPKAQLIDGCENAYFCDSREDYLEQYFIMRSKALKLVAPENIKKFKTQTQAGFALYLDAYINPKGSHYYIGKTEESRLMPLRRNLENAFKISDKYVWTWGEQCRWWKIPYSKGKRKAALSKPGKYRLWFEAMPGIRQAIKQAKNSNSILKTVLHQAQKTQNNLIKNPGFEIISDKTPVRNSGVDWEKSSRLKNWSSWQPSRNKIRGKFIVAKKQGIKQSHAAASYNMLSGCLIQEVKIKPDKKYAVLGYSAFSGKISPYISIRWKNHKNKWTARSKEISLSFEGSENWKRAAGIITAPSNVKKMVILLYVKNQISPNETCLFDNISVTPID